MRRPSVIVILFVAAATATAGSPIEPPKVSFLSDGCRLELRRGNNPRPMLWLACRGCSFVLIGRASLEGQVKIRTPEQALEFVRLFTTPETWYLGPERMVEVRAGREPNPNAFMVPNAEFARCCVPPKVQVSGHTAGGSWFDVQRTVVDEKDDSVYAITETVGPDGRLTQGERRLLTKDGRRLGRFIDPYDE